MTSLLKSLNKSVNENMLENVRKYDRERIVVPPGYVLLVTRYLLLVTLLLVTSLTCYAPPRFAMLQKKKYVRIASFFATKYKNEAWVSYNIFTCK